jgi:hypothetical protein
MPDEKSDFAVRIGSFARLQQTLVNIPATARFPRIDLKGESVGSVAFARGTATRQSIDLNAIEHNVRVFTPFNLGSRR